jgi:outer membrane protein TolC
MDSLRILLALPLNTEMRIDAPLDVAKGGVTLEQAVAIALERRVELRQAEDDVSEARRLTRVAEINTQIDVDVVLSLGQTGTSGAFADSFELGSPQLGISLASNSDVRRIAEKAAYEQARIRATITNRSYRLRQDLVIQDVKRGLRRVELGRRSIEVQRAQITQAQGKLIVARKKFELGLATNYNVVEAEDDLRTAETELIRAVASTVDSQYSLRAAIGTLVEIPEELQ